MGSEIFVQYLEEGAKDEVTVPKKRREKLRALLTEHKQRKPNVLTTAEIFDVIHIFDEIQNSMHSDITINILPKLQQK